MEKKMIVPIIICVSVMVVYLMEVKIKDVNRVMPTWMLNRENSIMNTVRVTQGAIVQERKDNSQKWINVRNDFSIFSVIGEQSFTTLSWNSLVFTGLEMASLKDIKYKCCYRYSNGSIASVITGTKRFHFNDKPLAAIQIVCDISNKTPPDEATLVSVDATCNSDAIYIKPIYSPVDPTPRLVFSGKMAYGSKNSKELIEWMEFHLHFGGGPFYIYAYADLNVDAVKVLNYYDRLGVLKKIFVPYVPTIEIKAPPGTVLPQRARRGSDVAVTDMDYQQRARHHAMNTMIDTDEFIIPRVGNITSYVKLVDYFLKKYPKAAYFTLNTEVHLKEWEKTDPNSSLMIGQYEYHSKPDLITEKNIFHPQRIEQGSMWAHSAIPLPGFIRQILDPNDAVLKHYRYCREDWFPDTMGKVPCQNNLQKILGHFMGLQAKQIEKNVLSVLKELEL